MSSNSQKENEWKKREFSEKLETELYDTTKSVVYNTYKKGVVFLIIFALFVINLYALALSLHCNTNTPLFTRLSSALFAFMFGFFYIMVNYYYYRVNNPSGKKCTINSGRPFGFFTDVSIVKTIVRNVKETAKVLR